MLCLLVKSQKFSNQAGYYLHNGRWHSIKQDKPVPKSAPIAQHPKAAGAFSPAKHMTEEQWEQLKLPADHTSGPHYNAKLAQLKQHSEAGDVTAILGTQFGTDTYAKKAAKVANHLLEKHGSTHQVVPGQKAGSHPAVNQAPKPEAPAAPAEPVAPTPEQAPASEPASAAAQITPSASKPKPAEPSIQAEVDKYNAAKIKSGQSKITIEGKDYWVLATGATNADGKIFVHVASATEGSVHKNGFYPKQQNLWVDASDIISQKPKRAILVASKEPSSGLSVPEFQEGKNTTGVVAYYEGVSKKIIDMAEKKDIAGLDAMPTDKGHTWKGKTPNSKALMALHATALAQAKGGEPSPPKKGVIGRLIQKKIEKDQAGETDYIDKIKNAGSASSAEMFAKLHLDKHNHSAKAVAEVVDALKSNDFDKAAGQIDPGHSLSDYEKSVLQAWAANGNYMAPYYMSEINKLKQNSDAVEYVKMLGGDLHASKSTDKTSSESSKDGNSKQDSGAKIPLSVLTKEQVKSLVEYIAGTSKQTPEESNAGANLLGSLARGDQAKIAHYAHGHASAAETGLSIDDDKGPQDGDTKQGADGTLVFTNGRWHKQDAHSKTNSQHPIDAVPYPALDGMTQSFKDQVIASLASVKESIKNGDFSPLKGAVKQMGSGKVIITLPNTKYSYGKLKIKSYGKAAKDLKDYIDTIKAAAGKPPKKAKGSTDEAPTSIPAPVGAGSGKYEAMDSWVQTGQQQGSNPGGRFKDSNGDEWYCKFPSDEEAAKSEVLAAHLYSLAGVAGQDAKLITRNGKIGIASRWVAVSKKGPADLAKVDGVQSGFAVDAWLANWDVVGKGYDNLQVDANGKAIRIDAGGALRYRAQGEKKAFTSHVGELDSLRDHGINAESASIFGQLAEADIAASAARVLAISDKAIRNLVAEYGPGDLSEKQALADVLIARKADIAQKYPKAAKVKPPKPEVKFDASKITTPPNFLSWNTSGKGLSSHQEINEANNAAVQAIYQAALKGDLDTIKNAKAPIIDKDTKQVTKEINLGSHLSAHVKAYWKDLVSEVDLQLNPPRMPDIGEIVMSHDLGVISSVLKVVNAGKAIAAVASHNKIGAYIVLGKIADFIQSIVPKIDNTAIASYTWQNKASAIYQGASKAAKDSFSLYLSSTGANQLNTALRNGDLDSVFSGKTVRQHVKDMEEIMVDIPEGSTFVRRMGQHGYGQKPNELWIKQLQQFLMTADPGTVIQEPGFSSTSWSGGSGVLSNNDIEWEFVAAKGVKMFPAWLTANKGEGEGLLPPNSRYVIVSSKKDGKTVRVKAMLLPNQSIDGN